MGTMLTVVAAVLIVGLGLLGWRRGVTRGLIGLVGTLMGAVLVDLWGEPWAGWLRTLFRPANAALLTWWAVTLLFMAVALLIGYGSSLLLAQPAIRPAPATAIRERLIGALVGALNGTLLISYPLHYVARVAAGSDLALAVDENPALDLLRDWLPWFVLTLVAATAALVIVRVGIRVTRAFAARPAPVAHPPMAGRTSTPPSAPTAGQAEKLRQVDKKIDEALNRKG